MEIISRKRKSGITASSARLDNISEISDRKYDMVVITSSWDARCLNLTECKFGVPKKCILILFDDKDSEGIRAENDQDLMSWATSIFDEVEVINGQSVEVDSVFNELYSKVAKACIELKSPMSILFDLSTCPRFLSLSLLSKGFHYGLIKSIDYFYGECRYPSRSHGIIGESEVTFTSGEWTSKPVSNLLGEYQPGNPSRCIVSVGFEGAKTLRALNREDPDSVLLLVPDPGYDSEYIQRVMEANSELIKSEDIDEESIIRSNAGDAVDVWSKLDELDRSTKFNQKLFCAGTKPHSLGMALTALTDKTVAVIYSQPQKHATILIEPVPIYWLYSITSITVPM